MTPGEIVNRLCDLDVLFQVKDRYPQDPLGDVFTGLGRPPGNESEFTDWEDGKQEEPEDKHYMDTIKDPAIVSKYNAWFLGHKPPQFFKGKITGRVMSCLVKGRDLIIKFEEVPWGLQGGTFSMNCEYITGIDYKGENGTLYIASKIGHIAIKIHEITEEQCTKQI
jgi:hypothetical protein